ncbi:MAG: hypothetical protein KDD25_07765, partial [Bdellovibrionales bacterium]|nr:hypothetical protein [Bdellovibrionales bacterium]
IGLVIHPEKQNPDYIFTYGMIWYAIQTGKFLEPTIESRELGAVAYDKSEDFVIGEPTTEFLPESARSNLKKFLLDQGVYNPRICVLSGDGKNFDFGVFVESLGNPPEKEYLGISQALSWFLPQHYSISLISDADFRVSFPL